ncbi:MAG TPA: hypothetical protein VHG28_01775 [Longimicrobiaceae bacterium]|nr:hypothetical protein [Longimicrobiaceae bacterium]
MSTLRRASLATLLVLLALPGCSGPRVRLGATPPIAPDEAVAPPLPETLVEPRPGPREGVGGVYLLVEVGDTAIPALVERRGECVVRVVAGSLSLEDRDFAFSATTQESCSGRSRDPVTLRARGEYGREGGTLLLRSTEGDAFTSARVQIVEDATLQLVEMITGGAVRGMKWEFHRGDPQPRG